MICWPGRCRLIAWLLAVVCLAHGARAQEAAPTAGEVAGQTDGDRAVELGRRGLAMFQDARWIEAHALFSRANELSASPVFEVYMARSLRNAGRLLEARTRFRAVADRTATGGEPPTWRQAQLDARSELGALEASLPTIVALTRGASGATITIDGTAAQPSRAIQLDPGKHQVVGKAKGKVISRDVSLEVGSRIVVELDFEARRAASPLGQLPPPEAPSKLPGAIVVGAGAAALVASGVFGVLALNRAADVHDRCPDDVCPPDERSSIEGEKAAATDLARASTLTALVGAGALVVGVVLLVVQPGRTGAVRSRSLANGARLTF